MCVCAGVCGQCACEAALRAAGKQAFPSLKICFFTPVGVCAWVIDGLFLFEEVLEPISFLLIVRGCFQFFFVI